MDDEIRCTKCGITVMKAVTLAMICAFGAKMHPGPDICNDGKDHDWSAKTNSLEMEKGNK